MNSKLHTKWSFMVIGLLFIGAQAVSAQGYQGIPFTSNFPAVNQIEIGTGVGVYDKVQLEYFDAMPNDATGENIGNNNPDNGIPGTYWDKSIDGSDPVTDPETGDVVKSSFRLGTDVDIIETTDPEDNSEIRILTGNQGQEYQFFTLNVLTTGMYTIRVRYSHTSPDGQEKMMQVFTYDPSNLSNWTGVVMNSSASGANPPNMERTYNIDELGDGELPAYGYSQETTPFELTEGEQLIRVRSLSAGWQTDYIEFKLVETLSAEDFSVENQLKVYPNPSRGGQFQLSKESKWSVYSLLGAKVLEGEGKTVDLSSAARGTYILKTTRETKKLIYN